ncbi:MAG: glucose-1-phosphate cytidylyltransferase [Coleofasciculaceae cyanobacterium SM2_1_6]|nr:glucose-1-phosphate cytidylyltransferase [Coleofasciculaceae cyanobacterium SM2_1_6]
MKVVILAGGLGSRLAEETEVRPKPMVEIGNLPILWHIMKTYSAHNLHEFIICCGYKGYVIKEYFANYFLHRSDVTFDMQNNHMEVHQKYAEPWRVTLVDTGESSLTGGRLKRVKDYVGQDTFCFTYGDGVSDVDIGKLIAYHRQQGLLATITAVQPPGRYGALNVDAQGLVTSFQEKPQGDDNWINGGYFVLEPGIFDFIADDQTSWELEPLTGLVNQQQLAAFYHGGFWHPMDTLRDKKYLESLWNSGKAPWKVW